MYVKVYVPLMLGPLGTCIHEEFFFRMPLFTALSHINISVVHTCSSL